MSDKIWFSDFLKRPGQYYYYRFSEDILSLDEYRKMTGALRHGAEYDYSWLPNKMVEYLLFGSKNRKLKPAIAIDTFYVNDALHDLLAGFNLGKTHLHPVSFYDKDGVVKQHDGQYYMVQMKEPREVLDRAIGVEQGWISEKHAPSGKIVAQLWGDLGHWPMLLKAGFSSDVDLWCDFAVQKTLFFSDRLKQALEKAGYGRMFKFVECA